MSTWVDYSFMRGNEQNDMKRVSAPQMPIARGGLGLPIERDLSFRAEKRLSGYARDARLAGRIVV